MLTRRWFWPALGFVLLPACGGPPAAVPSAAVPSAAVPSAAVPVTVTLSLPGDVRQMTLQGSRIFGSSIEVLHRDQTYRGRAFNEPVDLRVDGGLVQGAVGGRTELHVEVQADSFTVRGLNAGKLGMLDVRPDRVVGQLGGCQYDLHGSGGGYYQGLRACSARPEAAALRIAPEVAAMSPQDRAALLAILLTP
jgi:hypothetical protein